MKMHGIKTVSELIAALQTLPADALVFAGTHLVNNTERDRGTVGVLQAQYSGYVFISKMIAGSNKEGR